MVGTYYLTDENKQDKQEIYGIQDKQDRVTFNLIYLKGWQNYKHWTWRPLSSQVY